MVSRIKEQLTSALLILTAMQMVHGQQTTNPDPAPMTPRTPESIVAEFVRSELRVREALKQYTFKRDVVLQTIGPNGQPTGQYIRNSHFLFDDKGNNIPCSEQAPCASGVCVAGICKKNPYNFWTVLVRDAADIISAP